MRISPNQAPSLLNPSPADHPDPPYQTLRHDGHEGPGRCSGLGCTRDPAPPSLRTLQGAAEVFIVTNVSRLNFYWEN